MKELLFTVCGRGGSKAVRNKNIRSLCGVPLIVWTLFDAVHSFEKRTDVRKTLAVDSDSDEILSIARSFCPDALFHKRRDELAGDTIAKMDVLREVSLDVQQETGRTFDALIDLDITSPLRTTDDIEESFSVFERSQCEVVFSVVPARRNPYFNMIEISAGGEYSLSKPSEFVARQQAPLVFDMNASLYIYQPDVFQNNIHSPTRLDFRIYIMRDYKVIDIDSEEDLHMMELLISQGELLLSAELLRKKRALTVGDIRNRKEASR
jgi:CMP-N,N'-diacetyllegionaminic acid synthase